MSEDYLHALTAEEFDTKTFLRPGEIKVGEVLKSTSLSNETNHTSRFKTAFENGVRYAVLLIPEDIGPRGNLGRPGAAEAPFAFLSVLSNMQSNKTFDYSKVLIAGIVSAFDLQRKSQEASTEELRKLCVDLDKRVQESIECIVNAGLKPIVIGGGNNNSLPTIRAVVSTKQIKSGLNCINCDPHADYRPLEGRHSGNPFSYANNEGLLDQYCVFGLHESYNSQEMIERLENDGHKYTSFDEYATGVTSFDEQLKTCHDFFKISDKPIGLELDLDSIKNMPTSALTPIGITEEQALMFIHQMTTLHDTHYLHLSEGAPSCTTDDGTRIVGKFMAQAVTTYLKADKHNLN